MSDQVQTWCDLGEAYLSIGWYAMALQSFREAVAIDPQCAAAWRKLALVHERAGQMQLAVEVLEEATRLNPRDILLWEALGVCHHHCRKPLLMREVHNALREIDAESAQQFYEKFIKRINSFW
ncbi:MAG: tetratricopeptide repeat protein [Burkholderiales bacterium]